MRSRSSRLHNRKSTTVKKSRHSGSSDRAAKRSANRGFEYKGRSADAYVTHKQKMQTGDRDSFIKAGIKQFKPADGKNTIRVLPPTFEGAQHFALDAWINWDIGSDGSNYLSLAKMKGEEDPIEEERMRALDEGDDEYADTLKPKLRPILYIIDRKNPDDGVLVFAAPQIIINNIEIGRAHV